MVEISRHVGNPVLSVEAERILHLGYPNGDKHFTLDDYRHQFSENIVGSPRIEDSYYTLVKHAEVDPVTGEFTITKSSAIRYLYEHTGLDEYRSAVWWDTFGRDSKQFVYGLPAGIEKFMVDVSGYAVSKTAGIPDSPVKGLARCFWAAVATVGMTADAVYEGGIATYNMGKAAKLGGSPELAAHTTFMGMTLALQALLLGSAAGRIGGISAAGGGGVIEVSLSASGGGVAAMAGGFVFEGSSIGGVSSLAGATVLMSSTARTPGDTKKDGVAGDVKTGRKLHSDEEIAAALKRHGDNRTHAGRDLGYTREAIEKRITRADSSSPLAPYKEIKGKRGRKPRHSDEEIAAALKRHGGNRAHAGRELGHRPSSIRSRISRVDPSSLLVPYKKIKGKGRTKPRFSDAEIAAALERHGGNRTHAGRELGHDTSYIGRRIARAGSSSPLAPYKEIKGKGRRKPRFSDEEIAAALERHGGNRVRAGRDLGYTREAIEKRISRAGSSSPLAPYKNIKGRAGHIGPYKVPKIDDRKIAIALREWGGNRILAGEALGLPFWEISERISSADAKSPLINYFGAIDVAAAGIKRGSGNLKDVRLYLREVGAQIREARVVSKKGDTPNANK